MRDPNRLEPFYEQLCKIHQQYFPDWRAGQFFSNFLSWHRLDPNRVDPFYLEEDQLMEKVYDFINEIVNIKRINHKEYKK